MDVKGTKVAPKMVSIVIPNFNGRELLEKNIPSVLKAASNNKNSIKEIVVVDDGSQDFSVKFLKTNYPEIKVIRHRKNRGFSAAVNTGARSSIGDFIALINNDVSVTDDFLESVLPHFSDDSVFAVSLHEKGYGWSKGKFQDGFIVHEPGTESRASHDTFWVSGGSGVFRRKQWMALGGMDEKLLSPFYWEDVDLCYRAMKRGWKLFWEPSAKVFHEHESTTSKISAKYRQRVQERNHLLFIWKNLTSSRLFRIHIKSLFGRIKKHPGYFRIVLMSLKKVRWILRLRKKEIKESKVSDEAILAQH